MMKKLLSMLLILVAVSGAAQTVDLEDDGFKTVSKESIYLDLEGRCLDFNGILSFEILPGLGEKDNEVCYRYKCTTADKGQKGEQGNIISVNQVEVLCSETALGENAIVDKYRDWNPKVKVHNKKQFRKDIRSLEN